MNTFDGFVHPKTKQPLFYDAEKQVLYTKEGNDVSYPVINEIPRFVPPELYQHSCRIDSDEIRTGRSFGDKWQDSQCDNYGQNDSDYQALQEHLLSMLGCDSLEELSHLFNRAEKILDAGCGVAWAEYLFDLNKKAERHCIDLSLAVEVAHKNTAHMHNVTVSQASVIEIPYPDETFDIVFSCGVVHHTPDPKGAVLELGRKVKQGGCLGIYIYNKKPFIRELCDLNIRKQTTKISYEECMEFSRKMTMLGKALSKITETLDIEEDIELLGIKAGKYNLQRFIYDHILKCWYNPNQSEEHANIVNVDWYHPHYASHHTEEDVTSWFDEAGFIDLKCIQPPGWEHSGYFFSGRKL
jgi:SAM-dependent methyltransferase/uncharacterized protein YbaR (Trm112 family)